MQSIRRSTFVLTACLLAAGLMAACDRGPTSPAEAGKPDPGAESAAEGLRTIVTMRARDGTLRSHTDSSVVAIYDHGGGARIIARDVRPIDPKRATVSRDDGSLALRRKERLIGGRSARDSAGNVLAMATFGGEDGAPPELTVMYRNGKPIYAIRTSYTKVGDKWIATETRSTVFDATTGEARTEIAMPASRSGRAGDLPTLRGSVSGRGITGGSGGAGAPTTQETCTAGPWCDFLYWSAATAIVASQAAFSSYEAAYWSCAEGIPGACELANRLYKVALVAVRAAEQAMAFYQSQCGRATLQWIGSVDPAVGADVTGLIERSTDGVSEECDNGTGGGGSPGGGGVVCRSEWMWIEISYDGGMTWSTLWQGEVTVCEMAT